MQIALDKSLLSSRIAELSKPQLKKLAQAVTPKSTRYISHNPTPKQTAFLLLPHEEAFFGGSAGGGKSDALLMAALQYADVPGYSAILLRKSYSDLSLPGALMDRASSWLGGTDAKWNGQTKTWSFPSGATLTFGYLEHEYDKFRYKSAEFQLIGFDELTQFSESQYTYLFSRLRRLKGVMIPLRVRSASNPGDIGHDWVKQRFIIEGRQHHRVFIPANLDDNPYLDREEYLKSLANLDPLTKRQLLEGDWSARKVGGFFNRDKFKIIDEAPSDLEMVRYWDCAATEQQNGNDPDWTVGALVGRDGMGRIYLIDIRRVRKSPADVESLIKQTAELDGRDIPIWKEQEPGSSGVMDIDHYNRKVLLGYNFHGDKVTGSKSLRAAPLASQVDAGNVYLIRTAWLNAFLDECDGFPDGSHDDQIDAVSGALEKIARVSMGGLNSNDIFMGEKRVTADIPW